MPYVVILFLAVSTFAADSNEIARAIQDLGAKDHKTRETATKFLAEAGKDALPALERAAKSSDPEIRLRAEELLPSLRLGIPASFPKELRDAVGNYRKLAPEEQAVIVNRLIGLGRPARHIILELARSEPDLETRIAIFNRLLEGVTEELNRRLELPKLDEDAVLRITEGLELYQAVVPEDATLPLKVIRRFDTLGAKKQADEIFETTYRLLVKVSADNPDNPESHNDIAWTCAVARRRLGDGLKHIDIALAAHKTGTAPFLDTKAELLFQSGKADEALKLIEQAIEQAPEMAYFQQQRDRFKKGDKDTPPPEPDGPQGAH